MKKLSFILCTVLLLGGNLRADEGMWLLPLLNQLNSKGMKDAGLMLNADDIYNINHSSLKDAIVIFGGGCTGEVVSPEGLLLTNHHCGYGMIQALSSVEHNYLRDGRSAGCPGHLFNRRKPLSHRVPSSKRVGREGKKRESAA